MRSTEIMIEHEILFVFMNASFICNQLLPDFTLIMCIKMLFSYMHEITFPSISTIIINKYHSSHDRQ